MPSLKDRRTDGTGLIIDGHGYVLEPAGVGRTPIAAQRQLVDDGEEPGDRTINGQGSWKRTAWSFDHGAGQAWWDEDADTNRRQFRTSLGVDPWDRRELKLAFDVTDESSVAVTRLIPAGTACYAISDDGALGVALDPTGSWAFDSATTTRDVAWNGEWLYVAYEDEIRRAGNPGDDPGAWVAVAVDRLFIVGRRLLAIQGEDLVELDSDGDPTTFDTASVGRRFQSLVDVGGEVFSFDWPTMTVDGEIVADPNRTSVLYRHAVNDETGALSAGDPVAELPPGEHITAAFGFGSVVVLGTTEGIRLAQQTSGSDYAYGAVIAIEQAVEGQAQVVALAGWGQYVWFTWTNMIDGHSGLGRLDLDEFVEAAVPAYATDITTEEPFVAGTTRVTSVAVVDGRPLFAGDFGIRVQADTYVEQGDLWLGWVNYGSPERKAVLGLGLRSHPLPAGAEVRASVLVDQGTGREEGLVALQGEGRHVASGSVGNPGEAVVGEEFEPHLRLVRGDDTGQTPTVRRATLRVLPLPFRAEEIVLPIKIVPDARVGGVGMRQDPAGTLARLQTLYRDRTVVPMQLGDESMMVYVDGVAIERDDQVSNVNGWDAQGRCLEGTYAVTVITTDVPVSQDHRAANSEGVVA